MQTLNWIRLGVVAVFLLELVGAVPVSVGAEAVEATPAADCPVTPYTEYGIGDSFGVTWYGDERLRAGLDMSDAGVWYADPEGPKVGWLRPAGVELTVEGRRLDGEASPLDAEVTPGYENSGFQISRLRFPVEGCWEVVGRIPGVELRFVVWVHPGDQWRNAPPVADEVWAELERPLASVPMPADGSCPVSPETQTERVEGLALGEGPVYVQGLGDGGVARVEDDPQMIRVRMIADPASAGPLVIRQYRLGSAPEVVSFPDGTPNEMQFWGSGDSAPPDWRIWRGAVVAADSGCYALQIDGPTFTQTIVFEVL